MATNTNIISFDSLPNQTEKRQSSGRRDLHTPFQKEIKTCRLIIANSLPTCFEFLNRLDDSLFKLADQATNNQQQDSYFAAMREFRVKQGTIKKQFTQLVLNDFDNLWSTDTDDSSPLKKKDLASELELELSLMKNDDLEEDIALKKISAKGESLFGNDLFLLESRFTHMMGTTTPLESNPLSALQIAKHLQEVINPVTSDLSIKLVAYKLFEQGAIIALKGLCTELNEKLIELDVLPTLKRKPTKKIQSPDSNFEDSTPLSPESSSLPPAQDTNDDQDAALLFSRLRQLQIPSPNQEQNPNNTHGEPAEGTTGQFQQNKGSAAELNTLVSALSGMQQLQQAAPKMSYSESGELILPDLRQSILSNIRNDDGSAGALSSIDDDTLNVITFLFEFILEDRAIPAPIRAMLARLQLPMLKVALLDKTFFSRKTHSARVLLNSLADISTGWDHSSGTDDVLFHQIDDIVNSVLNDFDSDLKIFDDLVLQLKQFSKEQEQNSLFAEQKISTATEGQEKLIIAQQEVDFVINQHLALYSPVPKAVISLIEDSWKKVLKLRFLQKGKNSPEWENAVMLMDRLLWSVTPKSDAIERKQLLETIPKLLKALREVLSGASFNQHRITALFKDLQECHIKCLNGNQLENNELQSVEKQEELSAVLNTNVEELISIPDDQKSLSDEEALSAAKELEVGTWIEVAAQDDDEQAQRIKFSWRSNLTGRCLFVTYQGLKASEYSLPELASLFQQGQIVIFDEASEPLMDRAIVSMKDAIDKQSDTDET